jgi:hypothetical protein
MVAEDDRRMTPLMLSNKRAVIRINNLINEVSGDISTGSPGGSYDVEVEDGVLLVDGGTVNLHTASGNSSKRVIIKATEGMVTVTTYQQETIDGCAGDMFVPHLHAIELLSDGSNWWII